MAAPKSIRINTLADFTKHTEIYVEKALSSGVPFQGHWYRGIGNVEHSLIPSLFRHPEKKEIKDLIAMEARMLQDFRRQAVLMPTELSQGVEQ